MYDIVLVPTDGSRIATNAARHATTLAARFGADLHALHVSDPTADVAGDADSAAAQVTRLAEEADVPVETATAEGRPAAEILAYVDEHDVDLAVMGTHGRTGLDRYLLGSVAETVVRRAEVPVMTVRLPGRSVTTATEAKGVAHEALAREGYHEVAFPEEPHRESGTWVVRASADGDAVNVHVDAGTAETSVAHLDRD